jgi:hypothetical protein
MNDYSCKEPFPLILLTIEALSIYWIWYDWKDLELFGLGTSLDTLEFSSNTLFYYIGEI